MYLLFFLVWIIFNGKITTEIVLFGIAIAAIVFAFVCKFMDYSLKKEFMFYRKTGYIIAYIGLLIVEIVKANVEMIRIVLNVEEQMEPVIVKFRTTLHSETARVMLANSITLTPGTITISLEEDELTVHCLDSSMAEGLEDSTFVRLLENMEKREI